MDGTKTNPDPSLAPVAGGPRALLELALLFLRLGATAFGGPAAHVALFEHEFVQRRKWISRQKLLDLLGAVNLIPGPNSTELAIHIGYLRAGWPGLIVAGACFILPAMLMVTAIAWAYVRFGALPQLTGVLYGVKPVVIAVVLQALWRLGHTAIKTKFLAVLGIAAFALSFFHVDVLALLLGVGAIAGLKRGLGPDRKQHRFALAVMLLLVCAMLALVQLSVLARASGPMDFGLRPLLGYFLKVGFVLYGSGYVLLAFLQSDLVERWHWLTPTQLLDATAVGQVTPGPLFTTATFIGYLKGGLPGALVATFGIFFPAFILIALSGPLVPRLRASAIAGALLDGVNVASLALMAAVTIQLARAAVVDYTTAALALGSAVALVGFRVNSVWPILGGAAIGLLMFALH